MTEGAVEASVGFERVELRSSGVAVTRFDPLELHYGYAANNR